MNKILVNLLPLLFFTTAGFYSVFFSNNQQKVDDWVGEYEAVEPNFIEDRILTTKHTVNKALYNFNKSIYLDLKKDYSFCIKKSKDTTLYEGTWEFKDKVPVLHFKDNSYQIEKLNLTNKVYYVNYVKPCHNTAQRMILFNLFKRID